MAQAALLFDEVEDVLARRRAPARLWSDVLWVRQSERSLHRQAF